MQDEHGFDSTTTTSTPSVNALYAISDIIYSLRKYLNQRKKHMNDKNNKTASATAISRTTIRTKSLLRKAIPLQSKFVTNNILGVHTVSIRSFIKQGLEKSAKVHHPPKPKMNNLLNLRSNWILLTLYFLLLWI